MLTLIDNLPDHVVGVVGSGKITGDDYRTIFIPALEKAVKTHRKVNVIYVLADDFTGFTPSAMWDDTKEGFMHLHSWDRVAMVCQSSMIKGLGKLVGFVLPLSLRTYNPDQIEAAKAWVSGRDSA